MATAPLHLQIPDVTTATLLRGMLATCETRADMDVFRQDFLEHVDMLSYADRMDIAGKSAARMLQVSGGRA